MCALGVSACLPPVPSNTIISLHKQITGNSSTALEVNVAVVGSAECVCSNCLNITDIFLTIVSNSVVKLNQLLSTESVETFA